MLERISVIGGAGRVGLCVALCLAKSGYDVMVMDVNKQRLAAIRNGTLETIEPDVMDYLQRFAVRTTSSLSESVRHAEILYVIVPTTSSERGYDFTVLMEVLHEIADTLDDRNVLVVIGSTITPQFVAGPLKEFQSRLALVYNPLFIRQGQIVRDIQQPNQVLIGADDRAHATRVEKLHTTISTSPPLTQHVSVMEAAIAKLAINTMLTMKIATANTIGDIALRYGARPESVLRCVGGDPRIGEECLRYGYGYGGPCLPHDNAAMVKCATLVGIDDGIFWETDMANESHTQRQARQLIERIQERAEYTNRTVPYVFESVTYKPGVDSTEHSQQLRVAQLVARSEVCRVQIVGTKRVVETVRGEYGGVFEYEIRE